MPHAPWRSATSRVIELGDHVRLVLARPDRHPANLWIPLQHATIAVRNHMKWL
jgi:hypothetical protein